MWRITFFGLKSGQDLKKRAAHPHQEFPWVSPGINAAPNQKNVAIYTIQTITIVSQQDKRDNRTFSTFPFYILVMITIIPKHRQWFKSTKSKRRPQIKETLEKKKKSYKCRRIKSSKYCTWHSLRQVWFNYREKKGYNMAARRYKISLRELKYIFQHQKRNFVSPTGHVMFCLLLIFNTDEIPNHFTRAPIIAILSKRRQKTVSVTA